MSDTTAPMRGLEVLEWRALAKGALRGFVTFSYGHVTIHDAPAFVSEGRCWINPPGRPRLNRDGSPMLDAKGRPLYLPIASWSSKAAGDRVQQQLIAQLRERFPDALGDGQ